MAAVLVLLTKLMSSSGDLILLLATKRVPVVGIVVVKERIVLCPGARLPKVNVRIWPLLSVTVPTAEVAVSAPLPEAIFENCTVPVTTVPAVKPLVGIETTDTRSTEGGRIKSVANAVLLVNGLSACPAIAMLAVFNTLRLIVPVFVASALTVMALPITLPAGMGSAPMYRQLTVLGAAEAEQSHAGLPLTSAAPLMMRLVGRRSVTVMVESGCALMMPTVAPALLRGTRV